MDVAIYVLTLIFSLAAGVAIVFSIPGLLVVAVLNTLLIWYKGFDPNTAYLWWSWLLWVVPEGAEYVLGIIAAKLAKAGNRTTIGAMIGGVLGAIVGAPFLFGLGALLGLMIGAFVTAFALDYVEKQDLASAIKVAVAVLISKAAAMALRFTALGVLLYIQWLIMFGG
jgi:uncharacterized protein YqgC (DUF456 family)